MRLSLPVIALLCCLPLSRAAAEPETPEDTLFGDYQVVEAASLHAQTLLQAPAAVTVISAEEIRTYGYRTLAEALSNVRGFYITDDRIYQYAGLRGFSLPGDYSTRFLMMLNGHYLTDNVYGSNGLLGQDFPLDMDLVQRIEVIRGPSSALYGSSGIFATINIVTKAPVDMPAGRVSTELASFGESKIHGASSTYLGDGANLLLSASAFHTSGDTLPIGDIGPAHKVDRESGYHAFMQMTWKDWSFTVMNGRRDVRVPTGSYETIFDSLSNRAKDERGFAEALYSRQLSGGRELRWRFYYDRYLYWGRYDYDLGEDGIEDNRDLDQGDWVGSRFSYAVPTPAEGILTVGAEANVDLRNRQRNYDRQPEPYDYLILNRRNGNLALFAQQELVLSPKTSAYLGARFDVSRRNDAFLSPRIALIHQPDRSTALKFLFGRSFRNPSAFEAAYEDEGFNLANPLLGPEKVQTFEGVVERSVRQRVELVFSAYRYGLNNLIQGVPDEDDVIQFQNAAEIRAYGTEMEAAVRPGAGIRIAGAIAVQEVTGSASSLAHVNSPRALVQARFDAPLGGGGSRVAAAYRRIGSRQTLSGGTVAASSLIDATITTPSWGGGFAIAAGVRNLLDRRVFDVVGPDQLADRLDGPGRSAFLKLVWAPRE